MGNRLKRIKDSMGSKVLQITGAVENSVQQITGAVGSSVQQNKGAILDSSVKDLDREKQEKPKAEELIEPKEFYSIFEKNRAICFFCEHCCKSSYLVQLTEEEVEDIFHSQYKRRQWDRLKDVLQIYKLVNQKGLLPVFYPKHELDRCLNKELIYCFYENLSCFVNKEAGFQDFHFPFAEEKLHNLRAQYNIKLNESILYNNNYDRDNVLLSIIDNRVKKDTTEVLIITDIGLYYKRMGDSSVCFYSWTKIDKIEYKELFFYFYGEEGLIIKIPKTTMTCVTMSGSKEDVGAEQCYRLAEVLTQMAQLAECGLKPLELEEEGRFGEALAEAEAIIKSGENLSFGYYAKAHAMQRNEMEKAAKDNTYINNVECRKNLDIALKDFWKAFEQANKNDREKEFASHIMLCIANTERFIGEYEASRKHYIMGLENCGKDDNKSLVMEALDDVENSLQNVWDNYTTVYDYNDRKFIMLIKDDKIGGCITDGITVFRMSNIPSCIKFQASHPIANQLYIGHPLVPSLYVPYEDSEDLFFIDKVHELRYLLECLGAEEISITSIKGKEVNELSDESLGVSGGVGIKKFSAEAEYNTQSKRQYDTSSHNQRTMTVKLDPMQRPFLPKGLIWYNEMPQWQRLVQSRMNGNLLEYSEFVSSDETKFTSSSEMTDIKASAKILWAKAHAEVNKCFEKQFRESTETQWKVDVKFRSMKDFEDQMIGATENEEIEPVNQIGWSKEEQDYAEEVKFFLEDDGVIDDSERRLLERKRIKLGVSQERAAEIESLLQPQLTEDEKEYLEAVKEELVEGMIPDASRRLLDRLRKRMDISDERAKEIEIIAGNR